MNIDDAYRLYLAVQLHFDLSSKYDIRKSKARLKNYSGCPSHHEKVFGYISQKMKSPADFTLVLAWLFLTNSAITWAPVHSLRFIEDNPGWIENHKALLKTPTFEEWIKISCKPIIGNPDFGLMEMFGLNPFTSKRPLIQTHLQTCPYFLIGLYEALDIWPPSVVQCITLENQLAVQRLYRYRRFIGDDLTAKAVNVVQDNIDIPDLKGKLAEFGKSTINKQEEQNEWQALFLN